MRGSLSDKEMNEKRKQPFSKAEKLMGGGVLLIVLSIVIPVWVAMEAARRQGVVRADLEMLVSASERFFVDYGYWPSPHMGTSGDVRYGREAGNDLVMNILRAVNGPGNEGHRLNPNQIEYLRVGRAGRGRSGLDDEGQFVDPWGSPYQVVLDTDMNNVCTMAQTIYPNQSGSGVVAWSYGPDRRSDTERDMLSWRN